MIIFLAISVIILTLFRITVRQIRLFSYYATTITFIRFRICYKYRKLSIPEHIFIFFHSSVSHFFLTVFTDWFSNNLCIQSYQAIYVKMLQFTNKLTSREEIVYLFFGWHIYWKINHFYITKVFYFILNKRC